jgi:hypothetical protein
MGALSMAQHSTARHDKPQQQQQQQQQQQLTSC